jgi:hypothetical protein
VVRWVRTFGSSAWDEGRVLAIDRSTAALSFC